MNRRLVIGGLVLVATAACGGSSQKATETKPADSKSAAASSASAPAASAAQPAGAGATASGQAQATPGAQQAMQGLQQLAQGLQQMSKNTAKPVAFEELQALLPDIGGWTKSDVHGEQQAAMGMAQSNAKAKYTKGESTIELEIMDSTMNQLILAPMAMFLATGYEEKTDDGYKKAVQISGFPGFEEWEKGARHGQATVVIANRFIVAADTHTVDSPEVARKAVESVNLSKLAGMK
jgi:hypothetical protein